LFNLQFWLLHRRLSGLANVGSRGGRSCRPGGAFTFGSGGGSGGGSCRGNGSGNGCWFDRSGWLWLLRFCYLGPSGFSADRTGTAAAASLGLLGCSSSSSSTRRAGAPLLLVLRARCGAPLLRFFFGRCGGDGGRLSGQNRAIFLARWAASSRRHESTTSATRRSTIGTTPATL
jgi:hypothetical protein